MDAGNHADYEYVEHCLFPSITDEIEPDTVDFTPSSKCIGCASAACDTLHQMSNNVCLLFPSLSFVSSASAESLVHLLLSGGSSAHIPSMCTTGNVE
jgi:hypothetical protein